MKNLPPENITFTHIFLHTLWKEHDKLKLHASENRAELEIQTARATLAENQLAAADVHIRELQAALKVAALPAESRANVIQLIQEAA